MRGKLVENVEVVNLTYAQSFTTSTTTLYNGVAATTTSYLDTRGYDEVLIVLNVGTFAATATASFSVVAGTTTDPTAATLITGASFTDVTASNDQATQVVSIVCKDQSRYLWLKSDKTDDVNAAAVWGATAVLGKADSNATPTTVVVADV